MDPSYGIQQQQGRKPMPAPPPSEAFVFEGPEGQAPTSILATGHLNEQARMDPSITMALSMANNFTGPSSVSKGATMQESFVQVGCIDAMMVFRVLLLGSSHTLMFERRLLKEI